EGRASLARGPHSDIGDLHGLRNGRKRGGRFRPCWAFRDRTFAGSLSSLPWPRRSRSLRASTTKRPRRRASAPGPGTEELALGATGTITADSVCAPHAQAV